MKKNLFLIRRLQAKLHFPIHTAAFRPWRMRWGAAVLYAGGTGLAFIFFFFLIISPTLPSIDNIQHLVAAQSSVILDREGKILYTIHGEENRKIVPLGAISPHLIRATLAIEDDQFYEHGGLDLPGILKAVCGELRLCTRRGGSTITQQFVKNAFLTSERTYIRKVKEALLAIQLERRFTKDEILEMYLNRIPYGSNIYGVELAAQTFFGKPAAELTLAESAILAAIPNAPSFYSPYGNNQYAKINLSEEEILRLNIRSENDLVAYNPEFISKGLLGKSYLFGTEDSPQIIYIKGRVDFVLERMQELDLLNETDVVTALQELATKEFKPFREAILGPHFVLHVRQLLEEKYGKEVLEKGGFKITTTLDSNLQKAAEEATERYAEDNEQRLGVTNASLVAVDPNNGQILAMVGSRDYWNDDIDGKVNVAFRPRLPGSSFKPIVYASAFLQGYAPSAVLYDVQTKFGAWYEPDNFDGTFGGPISMRMALAHSRNVPAVKTAYLAGISNVLDLARKMGIDLNQPDDWYGLSLALGAGEVELIDLVLAYSVFANGGYKSKPVAILKVEDRQGNILEEYESPKERELVLDPQAAYLVTHILSDVGARPEGFWKDQLTIPGQTNAAKTGTSNKKKENATPTEDDDNVPFDAWTLGYTTRIAAGVWAGNADGTSLKFKADGLNAAGRIWHDFMVFASQNHAKEEFPRPEGIRFMEVSKRSGKIPSEQTAKEDIVTEIFASFSVPTEIDDSYEMVEIDKVSGKLATEFTPAPARAQKAFFRHHSEIPENPQWEEPVRAWAKEQGEEEEPPTDYDDIHTAESESVKPDIRIVSPTPDSEVGLPYVGVAVDIDSALGVAQVDYYWDDELMESVTETPFKGRLSLRLADNPPDSTHTLKAVVFDSLYHSNQAAIEVKIGEDILSPEIRFSYPSTGARLATNSFITIQADAYDSGGDVSKVEFYFDDALKFTSKMAPYLWSFVTPSQSGEYTLKAIAYDYAGHTALTTLVLQLIASETLEITGSTRFLEPSLNQVFGQGNSVPLRVYLDESTRSSLKEFSILMTQPDQKRPLEIAKPPFILDNPLYTILWPSPSAGRYELFLKLTLKNGEVRFTERVPILVR